MTNDQESKFRLFYNHSIHPELMHLEGRRRRLLRLLALTILLFLCMVIAQVMIGIFFINLILFIPVALCVAYYIFQVKEFLANYKPRIVLAILDFIDNEVNYFFEGYFHNGSIAKKDFLNSRIFTQVDEFYGEDLIKGKVREMPFELCELRTKAFSPVRTQLDYVFNGIFIIGDYRRPDMNGGILVIPDDYRKYLINSEKAFHLLGGRRVGEGVLQPQFEAFFNTYATKDVRIQDVMSRELQDTILKFRAYYQQINEKKEIYFSIIGDKINIALTRDKNILEPNLWQNNVRYEDVREFYDDIRILLDLLLRVDVMN
jgi:hypothetical protein